MSLVSRSKRESSEFVTRITEMRRTGRMARLARLLTGRSDASLPVFYWSGDTNFGDLISPFILRAMFGIEPARVSRRYRGSKILAVGSIIGKAQVGDVVWGSGLIEAQRFDGRGIEFLAVRGPRSRRLIDGEVPEVYGDPAILLPAMYTPRGHTVRYDVGLVPHYVDRDVLTSSDPAVLTIDVITRDWQAVIDQMNLCDLIVSSSLHGIIVAEAYGIPAVWVQPTERLKGGRFKFLDYYESTDRDASPAEWSKGLMKVAGRAAAPVKMNPDPILQAWPAEWRRPHPPQPRPGGGDQGD